MGEKTSTQRSGWGGMTLWHSACSAKDGWSVAGICLVRPEDTQCQAGLGPKEAAGAAEGRVLP